MLSHYMDQGGKGEREMMASVVEEESTHTSGGRRTLEKKLNA